MMAATISTSTSVKPLWLRTDLPGEDTFCTALRIGTFAVPQQTEAGKAGKAGKAGTVGTAGTVCAAARSYDVIFRATSKRPGARASSSFRNLSLIPRLANT